MNIFPLAMTVSIIGSVLGDFMIKQGAGPAHDAPPSAKQERILYRRICFAIGLVLLTLHFAAFLTAMKLAPLTIVVPLMACTYVGTTLLAQFVLHEKVSPLRWAGIVVIMAGVILLGLSS